jgi:hypothetical protein
MSSLRQDLEGLAREYETGADEWVKRAEKCQTALQEAEVRERAQTQRRCAKQIRHLLAREYP